MSMTSAVTTQMVEQFFQLIEYGVTHPSQLAANSEKLIPLLNILDSSSELVKFTFEFYKNVHPIQAKALLSSLNARGAIKDESLLTKSCFDSFIFGLLFNTVTCSAIHCTKYCTQLWIERITNEEPKDINMPNPFQYLNNAKPTLPTSIDCSSFLQFKALDDKERKLAILGFRKLASLIPASFYPRIAVAFYMFVEFYKHETNFGPINQEISLWLETWYHMVLASLSHSINNAYQNTRKVHPLHHILCALMYSTKTIDFIASLPAVSSNIVNGLEILCDSSSGLTEKWISILLSEFQRKSDR